jgi:hypothetical protein
MTRETPNTLYSETTPVEWAADRLDLDQLRRRFGELFDRAAHAVQLAGFEQDDAVLERKLVCRVASGIEHVVTADALSDRTAFRAHLESQVQAATEGSANLDEVVITGLRVSALLQGWP